MSITNGRPLILTIEGEGVGVSVGRGGNVLEAVVRFAMGSIVPVEDSFLS